MDVNSTMGDWNNRLVSKRPSYILSLLRAGNHVLYADIDSVWKSSPLSYWDDSTDMMYGIDQAGKDKSVNYCTGLILAAPNNRTIAFFERWEVLQQDGTQRNQHIFNELLSSMLLKTTVLPVNKFPSGFHYFQGDQRKNAVVVHNNFIIGHDAKVARFKSHGLWREHERTRPIGTTADPLHSVLIVSGQVFPALLRVYVQNIQRAQAIAQQSGLSKTVFIKHCFENHAEIEAIVDATLCVPKHNKAWHWTDHVIHGMFPKVKMTKETSMLKVECE
jgi:hypothetical protein